MIATILCIFSSFPPASIIACRRLSREMTEMKKEKVSLFRFGIIFPLTDERMTPSQRGRMIGELCSKSYEIPFSTRTMISASTIRLWYTTYMRDRDITSLEPHSRSDSGRSRSISPEVLRTLETRHNENPETTITKIVEQLVREGDVPSADAAKMASIYRFFREQRKTGPDSAQKDRVRFEMKSCNDCWMLDAMSGPKVYSGQGLQKRIVTAYCFALIDDKSRLITHAEFYTNQKTESLLDCLWKAFNKRGLPRKVFTDNGPAMRDSRLALGCAGLEVQLSYATAFSPESKAKLERFWHTLRIQFLPDLPRDRILELYELNKLLDAYIDTYNNRYHSGIGMSPVERFLSEIRAVRPAPMDLPRRFRKSIGRTASKARTVQIDNMLYEVPLGYSGRKLTLRYSDLSEVEAFCDGLSIGFLSRVDLVANSNAHRHKGVANERQ